MKIISWIMLNGATILGVLQSLIKAVKELVTGVVNLISIFMPIETAENMVLNLRNILNKVDEFVEKIKGYLLP